jgi:hypothetical protein
MAKKKPATKPAAYMRGLAENEYVQNQLGEAAAALTKAYRRAAKGRGQAVEDKKLYSHLREAATSIRNAAHTLRRRKPKPAPKRRGRKLIPIAAAGCGAALLWSRRRRQKDESDSSSSAAEDGASVTDIGGSSPTDPGVAPAGRPTDD